MRGVGRAWPQRKKNLFKALKKLDGRRPSGRATKKNIFLRLPELKKGIKVQELEAHRPCIIFENKTTDVKSFTSEIICLSIFLLLWKRALSPNLLFRILKSVSFYFITVMWIRIHVNKFTKLISNNL